MGEATVDLFYRGLPLGSRARMTHIEARSAYVELAAPMPIGTAVAIHADGLTIPARVVEIHEQTAGSEHVPGMRLRASLEGEAERKWWAAASGEAQAQVDPPILQPTGEPIGAATATQAATPSSSGSHDTQVMEAMPEHLAAELEAEATASADEAAEDVEAAGQESAEASAGAAKADAAEESTDVHPVVSAEAEAEAPADPSAASGEVTGEVHDEPSGVVDGAESPEPPTSGGEAAPRGRSRRGRSKRR